MPHDVEEREERGIKNGAHWLHWFLATSVAAVSMIGYMHTLVYPRTEGEKLEQRVKVLEDNFREDIKEMRQKIDRMFEILSELQRRRGRGD